MKNKKKNNIIDFPTSPSKLERQVEAILFAASEPLDIETIEKRVQTSNENTVAELRLITNTLVNELNKNSQASIENNNKLTSNIEK